MVIFIFYLQASVDAGSLAGARRKAGPGRWKGRPKKSGPGPEIRDRLKVAHFQASVKPRDTARLISYRC